MGQGISEDIRITNYIKEDIWQDFIYQNSGSNIFHTPEMFQVFKRARNYSPIIYAAIDGHGDVMALLPMVEIFLMSGILKPFTSRSISYGGLLIKDDLNDKSALSTLLQFYTKKTEQKTLFSELRNLSDVTNYQTELSENGFIYEDHLNYLIDLNCSEEELIQRIGSRTRQHIRRGIRKGVVIVEELNDRNKLSIWYNIIKLTYKAARVPLADISLFEAAFDILCKKKMIKFLLARIGSDYIAASAELLFKDIIYGWYGGMDRAYSKYTPNEILMWHILEWGSNNGYKVYDFGGAGKPNEEFGIREFKAKFGGQLVCFGRNTKIHSSVRFKVSEFGYKLYRQFLSHL